MAPATATGCCTALLLLLFPCWLLASSGWANIVHAVHVVSRTHYLLAAGAVFSANSAGRLTSPCTLGCPLCAAPVQLQCKAANCAECENATTTKCKACTNDYTYDGDLIAAFGLFKGSCVPCAKMLGACIMCDGNPSVCQKCKSYDAGHEYMLDPVTKTCLKFTPGIW